MTDETVDVAVRGAAAMQSVMVASGVPTTVQVKKDFAAHVRSTSHRGALVGSVAAEAHSSIHRNRGTGDGMIAYIRMRRGHARLIQAGRVVELGPGDVGVYAGGMDYELHFETSYELVGVVVPVRRLTTRGLPLQALAGLRMGSDDPAVEAVGSVLETLEDCLSELPTILRSRLVDQAVETVEALSHHRVSEPEDPRGRLFEAALALIDERLEDPRLGPSSLAQVLYVSVSTLYGVFRERGLGIASTIRARRIDRCCADLADPAFARVPIAEIGARWGFDSPPYFSTVFTRTMEMSPREFRERVLLSGRGSFSPC